MTISIEDKVRGCLWGIVVGDALGAPVEGFSAEKIQELHAPGVSEYKSPIGHKWFNDQPLGFWTDDTQLSLAVIKGLLEAGDFDMDAIAKYHALAMAESVSGWGYSTQDSIRNLKNGVHWSKSGITDKKHRGTGNGIPMKIAPIAVWDFMQTDDNPAYDKMVQFAAMSHYTTMSAYAGIAHVHAIQYCLGFQPDDFDKALFHQEVVDHAYMAFVGSGSLDPPLNKPDDSLRKRLALLDKDDVLFEKGGCYVYHSLPFTYAYFLQNPTIQGLYDVINAGGDTDTNGSMLAALIGALHGLSVFPQELLDGIQEKELISQLIEEFIEKFVTI